MTESYLAVVIGLGRIGSSYSSDDIPRTHAGAYSENERITLAAGVDSDEEARINFSQKWGSDIPVFSTVKEMLSKIQPDIVSVCVPPPILTNIVEEFSQTPPKLFFLEKPVVVDPDNSQRLLKAINKIPTAVNYHRCWDPSHIHFFKHALESEQVISIRIIYAKGMFNYASHMIALLIQYFGAVANVSGILTKTYNASNLDPSLSFIIEFDHGIQAVFQGFDNITYDLLELEIMTTTGLFYLKSAGCRRRQELPKNDAFYPNYSQLIDVPYPEQDGPVEGLTQAVENIVNYLDGTDDELSCDLILSLGVLDVMWRAKEYFNKEKR